MNIYQWLVRLAQVDETPLSASSPNISSNREEEPGAHNQSHWSEVRSSRSLSINIKTYTTAHNRIQTQLDWIHISHGRHWKCNKASKTSKKHSHQLRSRWEACSIESREHQCLPGPNIAKVINKGPPF